MQWALLGLVYPLIVFFADTCGMYLEDPQYHVPFVVPKYLSPEMFKLAFFGVVFGASCLLSLQCLLTGRWYSLNSRHCDPRDSPRVWKWDPSNFQLACFCLFNPVQVVVTVMRTSFNLTLTQVAGVAVATAVGWLLLAVVSGYQSAIAVQRLIFNEAYAVEAQALQREPSDAFFFSPKKRH